MAEQAPQPDVQPRAVVNLPHYPPFDCKSEGKLVRWNKWRSRLENNVFIGYNITDDRQKKALLLSFGGDDLNDIVDSFPEDDVQPGQGETHFGKLVTAITNHFNPEVNLEFQRYAFRQLRQKTDSIENFYHELRQHASTCGFEGRLQSEIKSQLIAGCKSNKVREKGLSTPGMTLNDLLTHGRTLELTNKHAKEIQAATNNSSYNEQAHRVRDKKHTKKFPKKESSQTSAKCDNCGQDWPHQGGQRNCPARGQVCDRCGKMNHFSKVCKSSSGNKRFHRKKVRKADVENSDQEENYVFLAKGDFKKFPKFDLDINGKTVCMLADSGASVNTISEHVYKLLSPKPKLEKCKIKIIPYGKKDSVPVLGRFKGKIESKTASVTTNICVVPDDEECLLSWKMSQELNLLQVHESVRHVKARDNELIAEYSDLFTGLGKLKDVQVKLHIDNEIPPVAQQYRRVPFHVRKDIEDQIKKDLERDVIEKSSGPTPWVSPVVVVPKPNSPGKVRVCVDMRCPNTAIKRERHNSPTLDELSTILAGSTVFSKVDLNQGYNQLELSEESRYITTFATHLGLYRYKRFNFGINSAAEVFQESIRQAVNGLPGVINISDDILIHGREQEDHDNNLKGLFQRLREKGLTLNPDKCVFNQASIEFFGHVFSGQGITPSKEKLSSIMDMPSPKNATEVRSLLGMTNFCGARHVPNYSTLTHELRQLTHKDTPWSWTETHEVALSKLKEELKKGITLSYFNPKAQTELYVDASPVGLCAVLCQKDGQGDLRVVQFASRSLTPTEQRYSQTEREALAITWSCEHFHIYLFGSSFIVHTDHKPLTNLFGNPKANLPPRIERWMMRIQQYDFNVVYRPGADNPADYLSRHPTQNAEISAQETVAEEYIRYVLSTTVPKSMTIEHVVRATRDDPTLQAVIQSMKTGIWKSSTKDVNPRIYDTLKKCQNELTIVMDDTVLLKETRIVLPEGLCTHAVDLAHTGHQGIVKTLSLLREKVWFPNMHALVENTVKNCLTCQITTETPSMEPLRMSELPKGPWRELSADFCQIETGDYLLVIQDEYSRYVVVEIMSSISARCVIPRLDKVFSEFGIPTQLKTDNGPPFNSHDFRMYAEITGFKHRKITPLWPRANAETERFMRTLKKTIKGCLAQGHSNWKQEMYKFLLSYRTTPHSSTGVPPATVLFQRNLRNRLPSIDNQVSETDSQMRKKDTQAKQKMKTYADRKVYVKPAEFKKGDAVLLKDTSIRKSKTPYEPIPYTVTSTKGPMISAQRGERRVTRNSSFFKTAPFQPTGTGHSRDS